MPQVYTRVEEVITAIVTNQDIETFKASIAGIADFNQKHPVRHYSPMEASVTMNKPMHLKAMLEAGANVSNLVLYCIKMKRMDCMRVLLNHNAELANKGIKIAGNPIPPIVLAALSGEPLMVELLIEYKADLSAMDASNTNAIQTIIHAYYTSNELTDDAYYNILQQFVDQGIGLDTVNNSGESAFSMVVGAEDFIAIKMFLKAGVNPDKYRELILAAIENDAHEVIEMLLVRNPGLLKERFLAEHVTPLMYAARHKKLKSIEILMNHGASLAEESKNGFSTLLFAMAGYEKTKEEPHALMAILKHEKFKENGGIVSLNTVGQLGMTPLMFAVSTELPLSIVRALLEAGSDVKIQDEDGKTVLFHAIKSNKDYMRQLLFFDKSGLEIEDKRGFTVTEAYILDCIMSGNEGKDPDLVPILINAGASMFNRKKAFGVLVGKPEYETTIAQLAASTCLLQFSEDPSIEDPAQAMRDFADTSMFIKTHGVDARLPNDASKVSKAVADYAKEAMRTWEAEEKLFKS